jgi:Protein kinase domain
MEPDPGKDDVTMRRATPPTRSFASGRYVVRRVLGEGGQKVVYLVHDEALDRECALSMIKSEMLDDDQLQRLRREAQSMARLGAHSNIVTVHDIGEEDGKPFLVSEYVPAGELREELRKAGGPLPIERALAIARDVTRALAVAHAHGVVHRDLKPANVWLCDDGSAKLGDFGLAFSLDRSRLTMPGMMMGTAAYMAPEQALGQPVSERSDLYSLGVLMYEMVCGRPPFVDENPTAVIAQHLNAWPVAPTTHNSEVPASLEALILQLLAKPPAMRPPNAVRVGEELRRIADGLRNASGAVNIAVASPGDAAASSRRPAAARLQVGAASAGNKRRMRARLLFAAGGVALVSAGGIAALLIAFGGDDGAKSAVAPAAAAIRSPSVGDAPAIDLGPSSPPHAPPSDCQAARVLGQFDGNVLVCLVGVNDDQSHTYEVTVTKIDGRGSAIVALCTADVPTGNCLHLNFDEAGFTVNGCSISVLQFRQTFIGDPVVNRVNFVDPVSKTQVLSQGLLGDKQDAGGSCPG